MPADGFRPDERPAAVSGTDTRCRHARCDGDLHYSGEKDPRTGEDVETGTCPRWRDRGAVQLVSPFLFFVTLMSLLVLAFIAGENRRCSHLEATADPAFARYCTTEVLR